MKKISSLLAVIALSFFYTIDSVSANNCGPGEYVISAYYSPVPGQARYATGTYEGDIRLNGGGVTTASGVKVSEAPGPFVAGPPCFDFGTILEIESLGRHLVLDRGGAIQGSRLDIWMGYGDTGLNNALTWGKRSVYVYLSNSHDVGDFDFDLGKNRLQSYQEPTSNDPFEFLRTLAFGDTGEDVARLQQILKDVGFYRGVVNGVYDSATKQAVKDFNTSVGIIKTSDVDPVGSFGGDSVLSLKELVAYNREKYFSTPNRNLGRGSRGDDVLKLQQFLLNLGLLANVTGVYDSDTVNAVIAFQLSEGIISSPDDQGAGHFGPMTQLAFDRIVLSFDSFINSYNEADDDDIVLSSLEPFDLITDSLSLGSTGEQVKMLQDLLRDMNLIRIDSTGYFGPITANAVYVFQKRVGIVSSSNDSSAGFVGPVTRNALNAYLTRRNAFLANLMSQQNHVNLSSVDSSSSFSFNFDLKLGDEHDDVKKLQEFLKIKGYFTGTVLTNYFGPVTKTALLKFKQDNELLVTDNVFILDELTRNYINSLI